MKKGFFKIFIIILILLFSFGLRIYAPTADLPADISFSGSIYTDEGNQCHNSRSKILYDEWYPDDWRISNYNPVVSFIKYIIFKFFGVGLIQERLVTYIFAFLSLLVFYLILKSYFDFGFTILGTFLLGINFFLVMYNKIGTFETPMIFWMILALYFIEKFRSGNNPIFLAFSGASAFMAFIFKNISGYFVPVPIVAVLLWLFFSNKNQTKTLRIWLKNVTFVLLGIMVIFLIWLVLFYIPNREWINSVPGQYISNQVLPKNIGQAIRNFYGFNWKEQFYKIPVMWLVSILYIPLFFRILIKKKSNITEIGFFLYFLSNTLFFMFMNHRPTRYLIPVIPAMIFMTIVFLQKIYYMSSDIPFNYSILQKGFLFVFDVIWLSLAFNFCLFPLYTIYIHSIQIPPLSIKYFIASALLVSIVYLLKIVFYKYFKARVKFNMKYVSLPVIVLLLGTSFFINIANYLKWDRDKTYSVINISHELDKKLENAYIAGLTAPVAVLENRHKSLFLYPEFVNWDKNTFNRYPLTHALIASFNQEITNFFRQWPERMQKAKLLRVYNVKEQFLHLYSFVDPYISSAKQIENQHFQLQIINPKKHDIKTWVGEILFFKEDYLSKPILSEYSIEKGKKSILLKPGKNVVELRDVLKAKPTPESMLFFLEMDQWDNKHRYEAEKFPGKVGINRRNVKASAKFTRCFDQKQHEAGFLTFGPYIPYSEGFMIVDFCLKFNRVRSRIRPVAKLDVFSYHDKKPLAKLEIKPEHIQKNKFNNFRLYLVIPQTRYLEFRVFAERWSDIKVDYVEVIYYQGCLLNFFKVI